MWGALIVVMTLAQAAPGAGADTRKLPPAAPGPIDFATQVKPILEASCVSCHGPTKAAGGYRLDDRARALAAGDEGVSIVPGASARSRFIHNVARLTDTPMPPDDKGAPLGAAAVGILRAWIDAGAPWPDGIPLTSPSVVAAPAPVVMPAAVAGRVDFVRDVRPIFEARCYGCHGPKTQRADLRLDVKASALRGGDSGPAIQPGRSADSLLVKLVSGLVPDKRMPAKGDPLTPAEIGILRRWIDEGAPWPDGLDPVVANGGKIDHWAFRAPVRPAVPDLSRSRFPRWGRTPIDAFVLQKMEKAGLAPSPEADRTTLIRRLSLDLLGLPPSPEEVDAFLADRRPDAYERLVDRLLASPHYGERWGRQWLDAARYADTNGFEKDARRSIWAYRDWVIAAFNQDLTFDRFTQEQLAGDLLPGATQAQRVATGFLRNSMLNEEGGIDPEQFRIEGIIDRVDAVGKAFLGLTVNCAQCHNHKFDPIPQREYFEFFAFLNNDEEIDHEVVTPAIEKKRAELSAAVNAAEDAAMAADPELPRRLREWEVKVRRDQRRWTVLTDTDIFATIGTKYVRLDDGSFRAAGDRYSPITTTLTARTKLAGITGVRVELLTDPSLPRGGPGRDENGMGALSDFAVEVAPAGKPAARRTVAIAGASADFAAKNQGIERTLDGDSRTGWGIDAGPGRRNADRQAVYQFASPIGGARGSILTFTLDQKTDKFTMLGRFRISVTTDRGPLVADPLSAEARRALALPVAQRTPADVRAIFRAYRASDPRHEALNEQVDRLMTGWPYGPATLVLANRTVPRATHVFRRGDWRSPGPAVSANVPVALHPFPADAPRNRLGLARWITDAANPLTPRVIVNRIWQAYFGEGLVPTPEDLGTRAEPPVHPELLDWLAVEFRDGTRTFKAIHRAIVTSATYRQSSRVTPELLARDPTNRWFARAPRLRVEAEAVRDTVLAASGLLSRKVGGPSVFPPIPDGVLSLGFGGAAPWETSTGEDRYRRGLYTFWKRAIPYPSLSVFDAPNGDASCVRRIRSNTPLQALTTLNDVTFFEAAQALALRVWREGGDERRRMVRAFRLAVGRPPTATELATLLDLLHAGARHFRGNTAAAVLVASPDPGNPPAGIDLHALAPWTLVARVILNLDETITRE